MWRAISRAPSWILVTSGLAELNAGDLGYLGSRVRFVPDSAQEGDGFELVWGFSCQVVVLGLWPVLCSELEGPFFVPSPAIRFPERAEGVKGPKR